VRGLWDRLESWFRDHLPDRSLALRPGASEADIARAESRLGVRLPADYRASLRVHDGQDTPDVHWLPAVERLGSLASLVACWERDRAAWDAADPAGRVDSLDRTRRVRQVHDHPRQIPIAGSLHWDYDRLLLDHIPGPAGVEGQVIMRSDIDLVPVCATFGALLEQTARGLETGRIVPERVDPERDDVLELVYLAPRSKKPISWAKYYV
jgi:cell wall assembly regulator SMI1